MGTNCDTDYGPVFANVRERLALSKKATQKAE
jgi:hypothetical protein